MCFITNDFFGNPELDQQAATNHLRQIIVQVNRTNRSQESRFVSTLKTTFVDQKIQMIDRQLSDRHAINKRTIDILQSGYRIENDENLADFISNPEVHSPKRRAFLELLHPHQRALFLTQLTLLEDEKLKPFTELNDLSFTVIFLALVLARDNHNDNIEKIIDDYLLLLTVLGKPNDPKNNCLFASRELPVYQTSEGKQALVEIYKKCLSLIT